MTPRQQSILVGAVVTGLLSTSYLSLINFACCLGVILGGAVAVQQFTSRTGTSVETGDGVVLGALAGAGGAVLANIFDRALRPLGLDSQSISQDMMQNFAQMQGQQGMSPEMMQQFQGGGGMTMIIVGLLFGIVVNTIFGAIGGAIGAAIFGEEGQAQDVQPGGTQPGGPRTGGPEGGGTQPGGAQPGPSDGPQDESAGGSESKSEGSV
ncbi:hypothetical protein [Salinibacter ruber]|uniref:hypothetical protein n=1 Tax=Salinibacter ruber TaxID=146919 RepID=UPI000E6C1EF2|nr:hypothetical protein [Salinibacter ruber]